MPGRPAVTICAAGGWGLAGHASTNDALIAAARAQIASLAAGQQASS
jgi:hypothetical protein